MGCLLLEATKKSSERKYKCPYCNSRLPRAELVAHVDKTHSDMIPAEHTASRVVFNIVNKKTTGRCIVCGKETKWNESTWRYDKFDSVQCKEEYVKRFESNMTKTYGKSRLLDDMEHQKKMLGNRRISGTYEFNDGGKVSYVGSYEKKLLEFLNNVMGYNSTDIMSPGPSVEYEYEGATHTWILDQYIIPYNLCIDCKDGENNPNNREMSSYREKQKVKEGAIAKLGKYNYIRLTNNNFAQLLYIMAEIKEQMMDLIDNKEPIIKINESLKLKIDDNNLIEHTACANGANAVIGTGNRSTFIIPLMKKNSFSGENYDYAISNSDDFDNILIEDNDKVKKISYSSLKESYNIFGAFTFIDPASFKPNKEGRNLAEIVSGKTFLSNDQILYDSDFEQVTTIYDLLELIKGSFEATLKGSTYKIPVVGESMNRYADKDIILYESETGKVFLENTNTGLRSPSYDKKETIPEYVVDYINKGMI